MLMSLSTLQSMQRVMILEDHFLAVELKLVIY